ncbi:MAG: hypothetical protein DI539_15795 [Flavobacterium psychrophilum]|nr:MAG: hypothetical protein DI539_15795 [Flavobacterium psychrophilum]
MRFFQNAVYQYFWYMARNKEIPAIVIQVGERIKALMTKKGISVVTLSHVSGLDETTVRRYIKGQQEMSLSKLYAISKGLNVEVGDLFKEK